MEEDKSYKERKREREAAGAQLRQEEAKRNYSLSVLGGIHPQRTMGGVVWEDEVNKRKYQRVIGGAAWPGNECYMPTCHMAILGEDIEVDVASGKNKVWLLYEESAQSVEALLGQICLRMEAIVCTDWVMPVEDPGYIRVDQWIQARRRRRLPVPQVLAPPVETFAQLNALMQARTVTSKSFFFGPESMAVASYMSVPDADFGRNLNRYPAVGAVLYPLGYIDAIQKRDVRRAAHIPAEGGY